VYEELGLTPEAAEARFNAGEYDTARRFFEQLRNVYRVFECITITK
jgi:hypothetical protein